MAILTGPQIRDEISWNTIEIDPYDEKRIQPNSLDLTLGKQVRVYKWFVSDTNRLMRDRTPKPSAIISSEIRVDNGPMGPIGNKPAPALDSRMKMDTYSFDMDESGWVLKPGILYLMHTRESIHTKKFVTQLNGKSSIARLGVIVHFTAAFGETGFNGQYTLEVSAMHPVILYPGMGICQAVFNTVYGQTEDYQKKGHYVGDTARGAVPSHSYEQFEPYT